MQNHHSAAAPLAGAPSSGCAFDPGDLLQALVDVVCVLDGQGIFLYVSSASTQLFGYTPREMVGASFRQFIHREDIEKTVQGIAELRNGSPSSHFENRYLRKDGSTVPVIWSGRWDESAGRLYCVARDGTTKSEIEQRLVKAQQIARVANYEFDIVNHRYTYTSDTIFDIFGIDRSQHPRFTSELFWSRVHPDDMERVRQDVLQHEHLHSAALEYRIIHPDGKLVYINRIREVVRDAAGRPVKTIGTLQDITDHKLGELERLRSEERLRSLVKHGNDLIGILDVEGTYLFASSNGRAHIGYSAEALVGQNVLQFIHPDDQPAIIQALKEIRHQKSLTLGPFRYRGAGDEWIWLETTASNHLDNPLIGGLITNSRDVTEKKQKDDERQLFQQRIEEQNHMIVSVLEQMRDGFLSFDREGTVIYWNGEAERITGIARETALGRNIGNLLPNMEQSPYYTLYQRLLTNHEPLQETVRSPYSGKLFEVRAYKTPNGISVFFRDVTQHKAAEEELQKLSLIARETTNPVIIQDCHRTVQWVNNAFLNLTGYTQEECIGRFIGDICDGPATDPATQRYVEQQMERCAPYRIETLNYKKNGDTYWSDVSSQPVFNEQGEVVRYFSIATDITQRKRLERQLEREQHERQITITAATLKAQEQERTVVSQELHDNVNQVLTTVKLYTEMVRDGVVNQTEFLTKSIQLLQNSINEIRSLSKRLSAPSLGKIRLAESVKELIDAVAATRRFAVRLHTSSVTNLEVSQEVHLAVYRILQEHLTNVLKHAGSCHVTVSLDAVKGNIHLRVTDDGKGFDPTVKHNGIGIANMITRAESLNGTLTIRSVPGQGCALEASIPL
jgi:PAS domain S-box-containing protein